MATPIESEKQPFRGGGNWRLVTSGTGVTDARSFSLRIAGELIAECPGAVPAETTVSFMVREAPTVSWDGCYPELGVVPDEPQIPK